jgi:hypothetical protein
MEPVEIEVRLACKGSRLEELNGLEWRGTTWRVRADAVEHDTTAKHAASAQANNLFKVKGELSPSL